MFRVCSGLPDAMMIGLASGLISTAILVVNNLRDVSTDATVGKNTLVVRLAVNLHAGIYFVSAWSSRYFPFYAVNRPWIWGSVLALSWPFHRFDQSESRRTGAGPQPGKNRKGAGRVQRCFLCWMDPVVKYSLWSYRPQAKRAPRSTGRESTTQNGISVSKTSRKR